MATSDWRGLYTVPEIRYGEIYTNQDDYVLPENKKMNQYYRHRAYVASEMGDPRPGLKADYGVQHPTLGIPDVTSSLDKAPPTRQQKTQSTFDEDMRFAGDSFQEMKSIAENIPAKKWQ